MSDTVKQELKFLQSLLDLTKVKPNLNKKVTAMQSFKKAASDLVKSGQISEESLTLFMAEYELSKQIQEAKNQRDAANKIIKELEAKKEQISQAKKDDRGGTSRSYVDPCSRPVIRSSC